MLVHTSNHCGQSLHDHKRYLELIQLRTGSDSLQGSPSIDLTLEEVCQGDGGEPSPNPPLAHHHQLGHLHKPKQMSSPTQDGLVI